MKNALFTEDHATYRELVREFVARRCNLTWRAGMPSASSTATCGWPQASTASSG